MSNNFECSIELKRKGNVEHTVKAGNISLLDLKLFYYGFNGLASFIVDKEDKLDFFYEPAVIEVTIKLKSTDPTDKTKPLELNGIVTTKLINEITNPTNINEIQKRRCDLQFYDPAAAIWSQHYPTRIFTQKTMKDVINSFISKPISIKFDCPLMEETKPLIALGLGWEKNTTSFYTFLMWHLREVKKTWEYDYENKQYVIRDKKDGDKEPIKLPKNEGEITIHWPLPARHDVRIVNSYAESPMTKDVKGHEVFEGINSDILYTTPVPGKVDTKAEAAKPSPDSYLHQLSIHFTAHPKVELLPGNLFNFEDVHWGKELYVKKNSYRLRSLEITLHGDSSSSNTTVPGDASSFSLSLLGYFEKKEEQEIFRPYIQPPLYPFRLEGKIFSEVGEKEELTFDIGKYEKSSLLHYTITLPWAENQKVTAPFEPTYTNGQIYNPLLKGQRVNVEFHLFTAKIVEVKDWLSSALPHKTQANQILFAPYLKDKSTTVLQHIKEDDGTLTFFIERRSAEQYQLIRIKEDGFHIIVHKDKEEDPQCHLWMDNEHTITITSQDTKSSMTQQITLKPEEITTLCEKGGG